MKRHQTRSSHTKFTARRVSGFRVSMVSIMLLIVMAVLTYRMVDVQATPDERIQEIAPIPVTSVTIHGPRGAVLDRNGRSIAFSLPAATIVADPRFVEDPEAAAATLADVLNIPPEKILPRLTQDGAFSYVVRQVSPRIGERVKELELSGISVLTELRREHPNGDCSALAAVGRVNIDHVGMSGLEEAYNDHLTGVPGKIVKEVGAGGFTIPGGFQKITEAVAGSDITLTLDRNVQYQTEQFLIRGVANARASSGMALVALPATGEIVAMANVARSSSGIVDCTRENLAATWSYEPGSVFKPVIVAAALDSGAIRIDEIMTIPSAVTLSGHRFEDDPWHEEVEWNLTDILSVSSNVGSILIADKAGKKNLYSAIRDFGFGDRTSLDFKGETGGILMPVKEWNKLTLPTFAIGQGLAITPLQLLQAYSVIANDGLLVPLRLLSEKNDITSNTGLEPVRIAGAQNMIALRGMLESVVQYGTGRKASLSGFTMAGKTGTSWQPCDIGYECVNSRGEFAGRHHTATFAGIISNDDGPVLLVLVIIDDPKGINVSGGFLSAPLARQISEYAVRQLRMPVAVNTAPHQRRRAKPAPSPSATEPSPGRLQQRVNQRNNIADSNQDAGTP